MRSDFYNESLKNLSEYISRGITPIYTENNGLQVLNQKCVRDGQIKIEASRLHDNSKKKVSDEKIIKKNDILVNSTGVGTLGRVAQKHDETIATVDSHITIVRPRESKVNPLFLGCLLKQNQPIIESLAEGSTGQTELSRTQLGELRFNIPVDKDIQKNIGESMYLLDSKIEINKRVNIILETIAQTLFKSWFVDFDPVKAKIAAKEFGKDPQLVAMMAISGKSSEEINEMPIDKRNELANIADLFPDEMVESELGEIPKGWKVRKVEDFVNHLKETVNPTTIKNKTQFLHYSLPAFDSGRKPVSENAEDIKSNKYKVYSKSILISKLNPFTPRIWDVIKTSENSICSTEFQVLIPKKDNYFEYVSQFLKSERCIDELTSKITGTSKSHQRVSPNDITKALLVADANELLIIEFNKKSADSYLLKENLNVINWRLEDIRNSLLPRLLSGEITIKQFIV